MSLIKQLWIAIALVMSLAFGGSLLVSTLGARHYLAQQLYVKNVDNATSLALSLSQMPKDPVTVELLIAAQFDAGHYRMIRLTDPAGAVIVERANGGGALGAPEWFAALVPVSAAAGVAQVQDGWNQYGTLTLESHSRYAYESLWRATLQLLGWFLGAAVLTGVLGTVLLRHITRPLGRVVAQAEAIGGRRFVTTDEPSTTEFRSVVRAMNTLSARVRGMLAEESQRLEQLRRQNQHDELTGLLGRRQFLNQLDAALSRDDAAAGGTLVIVRVGELAALNLALGRPRTDALLCELAALLQAHIDAQPDWEGARLNGSDFALLACGSSATAAVVAPLRAALDALAERWHDCALLRLPMGATRYRNGEARTQVLARADGALAGAEQAGDRAVQINDDAAPAHADLAEWRSSLEEALRDDGVSLALYPALNAAGALLHHEAPMRLRLDGGWQNAGYFMPWAARLGLTSRLDAAVVRAALARIASTGEALGINLSVDSLRDAAFRSELFATLQGQPAAARQLWIELPEHGVLRNLAEFRALCVALRPLGCRLGIEHVGRGFSRIGDLHELGLDYLKLDASMVRDIDQDGGNQNFVRGLCVVAHAIGLTVIAEGVCNAAERRTLAELGLDGFTGPGIRVAE